MIAEIVQAVLLVLIAPLMSGIVSKFKAWMQNRPGADIFQPYRDLAKLFRKGSAVSRSCSGVFRFVPVVCMASMLILCAMSPFIYTGVLAPYGGLVTVVYMFTMYRFAMVLGGLEGGSTFGGMGSSREMMMSVLIEPALLLSIATLSVLSGAGTDMGAISASISDMGAAALTAPLILAACSFMMTLLAENARIPFDNPTTHLELTMVHEAMLLEYSGRDLAMMELSSMIRLSLFMAVIGSLFFPWGISTVSDPATLLISLMIAMVKMVVVAFVLALIESVLCKSRLFKTPNLLTVSFALSLIAMVSIYIL